MEASEDVPLNSKEGVWDTEPDKAIEDELRCPGRLRNPTEKMLAFQEEEAQKREKRLIHLYEQWKIQARNSRDQLKLDIPENQIVAFIDTLEKKRDDVINIYVKIRDQFTPSSEIRRRIDACEAVTKNIFKIAYERISGIDGDFDREAVKQRLRELLDRDYARSIYGSTVSHCTQHSARSLVAAKRLDAASGLATKEVEYETLLEEEKQQRKIQLLEEQQRKDLEARKHELERLKIEKDIRAAQARLTIYDQEVIRKASGYSAEYKPEGWQHASPGKPLSSIPIQQHVNDSVLTSPSHNDVSYLA